MLDHFFFVLWLQTPDWTEFLSKTNNAIDLINSRIFCVFNTELAIMHKTEA